MRGAEVVKPGMDRVGRGKEEKLKGQRRGRSVLCPSEMK